MARGNRDPRFARNLRRALDERGMTVKRFSRESGITESSAYYYANGERIPDVAVLRRIRATLGCTWDELLGD